MAILLQVFTNRTGCMLAPTFFSSICQSREFEPPQEVLVFLCSCNAAALDGTFLEECADVTCLLI